ncbi:MAG TPA: class I SAM-dependent methyltransferase [Syntrophorhabdaceae bacterium]|nr:class I SAM-dependent methyltransferase [Syntrophorhabdaceae bacterium]
MSAGSGRFSYDLIKKANMVVFCDIAVDSAVYLSRKILQQKSNALVFRCDYMSPPFKDKVFDLCICNDTLIYGYEHEMALLLSIHKILKDGGVAVLDFSNIYHRGFWHKPYTIAYSKREMIKMLKMVGFIIDSYKPIYYELGWDLDETSIYSKLLKTILPPTRYIFKVIK